MRKEPAFILTVGRTDWPLIIADNYHLIVLTGMRQIPRPFAPN
jgi:hypothetical protein